MSWSPKTAPHSDFETVYLVLDSFGNTYSKTRAMPPIGGVGNAAPATLPSLCDRTNKKRGTDFSPTLHPHRRSYPLFYGQGLGR